MPQKYRSPANRLRWSLLQIRKIISVCEARQLSKRIRSPRSIRVRASNDLALGKRLITRHPIRRLARLRLELEMAQRASERSREGRILWRDYGASNAAQRSRKW